ncbi:MAG TPA: hypothetical protein PKB05_04450 [Oligoflexia bacterium]|nr:hypothetical protein [Oligoflexia bacterium]
MVQRYTTILLTVLSVFSIKYPVNATGIYIDPCEQYIQMKKDAEKLLDQCIKGSVKTEKVTDHHFCAVEVRNLITAYRELRACRARH